LTYSVRVANSFERDLRKLRQEDGGRIWRALEEIQESPYAYKPLGGQLAGTRSARVGNLRVLYIIEEKERRIVLLHAGHRERVYES
jgi:mRNA interferase RelE/StbE